MSPQRNTPRIIARTLVAVAVSAALPASALGAAARVDFAIGAVSSVDASGKQRRLARGATVDAGDTVITGRGRAQLRFTDGSYTSLAPNTEFRIDDYRYQGERDREPRSFFSLLKGGLRTITGAIGKLRKRGYRLTTPVATIGIRGTEYVATFFEGEGLKITVGEGIIEVCSDAGCAQFESGETGQVPPRGGRPSRSRQQASTQPPGNPGEVAGGEDDWQFETGEQPASSAASAAGDAGVVPGALASGSLYALSAAFVDSLAAGGYGAAFIEVRGRDDERVGSLFDASGALVGFAYPGPSEPPLAGGPVGVEDAGQVDRLVGWGRWTGAAVDGASEFFATPVTGPYQELHYAVGIPTLEAEVPTSGIATYRFAGGTPPARVGAAIALGTVAPTSNLVADFATNTVTANLFTSVAGNNYVTVAPVSIGKDAAGNPRPRTIFGGAGGFTTGSKCSPSCSTYIDGFFAGSGASHAGLTYKFEADSFVFPSEYVIGSMALRR